MTAASGSSAQDHHRHDHGHHGERAHDHDHSQHIHSHRDHSDAGHLPQRHPHHGHSHAPQVPHPPSTLGPSILRLSLVSRLGVAGLVCAMLWGAVWLAMR